MMTVYGLTNDQIVILEQWAETTGAVSLDCEYPWLVRKLRHAWRQAGGRLPVTEAEALFLRPRPDGVRA